jgi:PPPDE putative peptidase domain
MLLPWGCVCEIGKCFNEVNSALHELGTGAYHVGIECNGIEYAYGACSQPNKTGVFSCIPKLSPGYQYRSSIDFGYVPLIRSSWVILPPTLENDPACVSPRSVTSTSSNNFHYQEEFVDGRLVIKEMAAEYMGIDYDILKRNCCTFAADACVRLGVPEEDVPTWFRNLAETGAYSHTNFVEPLQHVLSGVSQPQPNHCHEQPQYSHSAKQHAYHVYPDMNCHNSDGSNEHHYESEPGFEVIAQRNATNTRDVVLVVDANDVSFSDRSLRLYRKSETTMAY